MKHMESARRTSKSKGSSAKRLGKKWFTVPGVRFVVCVQNGDYVDLEPLKLYRNRRDASANRLGLLRILDESGEDYLYPADFFRPVQAPNGLFKLIGNLATK